MELLVITVYIIYLTLYLTVILPALLDVTILNSFPDRLQETN